MKVMMMMMMVMMMMVVTMWSALLGAAHTDR